ncbi:enoyl-CoA hydratase/isomerase family protein [Futiania mangrovi]|uniref:3-hydroxyisobutyryl-CoA hydrolase n=1 Tax=Futiania mangrovi TaxID=2959716 RepID=A0A9J6PE37_9PROT|nr:enoyl-CoA hydratase/isomerase family protein [Futiania mangrovii]MCP1336088.1 enoyl-CoA hydratase/isomerase family protein [Futiania mangrovii]
MTEDLIVRREGAAGRITLNRPKALNSLTLDMVRGMQKALDAWRDDPEVRIVLIDGAGEKAFCAGGDIRRLWESARDKDGHAETFWREEYILNAAIKRYPKPYVALIDGITMGGGVGVSAHGSHRVMTERTMFAMPETGIGFFPDVGGTHLLSHQPGEVGTYLALTGARLKGADVIYAGGADAMVDAAAIETLAGELCAAAYTAAAHEEVDAILDAHAIDPGLAPLGDVKPAIDRCFAFDRMEDILAALETEESEFAAETLKTLGQKSPTGLKLTLAGLRRARAQSLETALTMELRMSVRCLDSHDFSEGIRSVVVDKDHAPKWNPPTVAEVEDAAIEAFFAPLGEGRDLSFG